MNFLQEFFFVIPNRVVCFTSRKLNRTGFPIYTLLGIICDFSIRAECPQCVRRDYFVNVAVIWKK